MSTWRPVQITPSSPSAYSFELRSQSRIPRRDIPLRHSRPAFLLSFELLDRTIVRDDVAGAIRPAIELSRKHRPGERQRECIGDLRRSQASRSHVHFLLELNLAFQIELEFDTDQLIAQVGAVRQRQVRQLIPERAPHLSPLVGILDVAEVTNRLAATPDTFNREIMPHQVVDDSAAGTGVVNKDNVDLMLQAEVEDDLFDPDGIEAVQLDWLYRACVHSAPRIKHRAIFAEPRDVDAQDERVVRHPLNVSGHRPFYKIHGNELRRSR